MVIFYRRRSFHNNMDLRNNDRETLVYMMQIGRYARQGPTSRGLSRILDSHKPSALGLFTIRKFVVGKNFS